MDGTLSGTKKPTVIGSDAFLRDQVEKLLRESKTLKQKVELLDKENAALKKSLFDLSLRYNALATRLPKNHNFNLFGFLDSDPASETDAGNGSDVGAAAGASGSPSSSGFPSASGSTTSGVLSVVANSQVSIGSTGLSIQPGLIASVSSPTTSGSFPQGSFAGVRDVISAAGVSVIPNVLTSGAGSAVSETAADLPFTTTSQTKDTYHKSGKLFTAKHEFKNHSGAVYAVQFSPSGKLLATGSFDKTVRIFDPIVTQKEIHCFKKHTLNVSDLGWTADSTELLSGAYDQTCKIWDVESGKLMESYDCDGFVQSIMSYQRDKNIFFHGTSRNVLAMIDRRVGHTSASDGSASPAPLSANSSASGQTQNADVIFRNDAMINSLYILRDGLYVITCDSLGFIKTWDIRSVKCVYSHKSSPTGSPISHLAMCYTTPSMDEDPRFLAANSYDNVIRVYDRGFQPPKFSYRQTDALKGHKNKNWPIKSSFYYSQDDIVRRISSHEDVYVGADGQADPMDSSSFEKDKGSRETALLATGSSDPYIHVYAVSGGNGKNVGFGNSSATSGLGISTSGGSNSSSSGSMGSGSGGGSSTGGELLQRLEGHGDRVYAVNFHPYEPILASCSADFTVKLWFGNFARLKA